MATATAGTPRAAGTAGTNGARTRERFERPPAAAGDEQPQPSRQGGFSKRRLAIYVAIAVIPVLTGVGLAGFDIWREATYFVKTMDAQVAASVVTAQSSVAGRLAQYTVDVGDVVQPGDLVASLSAVPPAPGGAGGQPQPAPGRFTVNVRAPVGGTVLSRPAVPGAGVTAGQPLVMIGDLDNVWVIANVEESRVGKVRAGQAAEVYIQALDRTFRGEVVEVTPATAAVVSPAANQPRTGSGAGTARPVQTVSVRVAFDYAQEGLKTVGLYPGMSAEVKIDVR